MDIQKALELTESEEILKAAKEAEQRQCERWVVRTLYDHYYAALAGEQI